MYHHSEESISYVQIARRSMPHEPFQMEGCVLEWAELRFRFDAAMRELVQPGTRGLTTRRPYLAYSVGPAGR